MILTYAVSFIIYSTSGGIKKTNSRFLNKTKSNSTSAAAVLLKVICQRHLRRRECIDMQIKPTATSGKVENDCGGGRLQGETGNRCRIRHFKFSRLNTERDTGGKSVP
ncbi:hypothetical protein F2P81_004127 [Scophthalmus maximus]|uniref:Uncharacterized protein n=1 Tax=Scophthalmus maximus TaxID=52904 RepID=A0A6A4TGA3_SCOMX|nr:hypothetical protein F2P81_004127 [Scophthalmus maximus]